MIARASAEHVEDLWIGAEADGRPRHLYARLGFRPAWTLYEAVRDPVSTGVIGPGTGDF